jgi:general secretion pathway protein D
MSVFATRPLWRPAAFLGALFAFILAFALAGAERAIADITLPPAPDAVLTDMAVKEVSPSETQLTLTFSPKSPTFSVVKDNSDHTVIGFARSTRGPAARTPAKLPRLLQGVEFEQNETILMIKFVSAGAVSLKAAASGAQAVTLTIKSTALASNSDAPSGPVGPLPKAVDRPPGEDGFELVPLKYADVSEVVGLLTEGQTVKSNDAFLPIEPAFGSAGMNGTTAAPPPAPPTQDQLTQPLAQSVDDSIAIDRRLNAVILKGSPERIARMKAKIAEIDVPVESVILETEFVELDESGAKNVGFSFNNANGQAGQVTLTSEGFTPPGLATGHGIISSSLQAALYAQIQAGHGRIVSKPRISAASGGTAKIITGDALPILTNITLSGVNGVSQQVQYVNVGVTLQIAPRVSSDGYVTSHVFCVVSSVSGFSQGYPTISQREAETSATVRDGEAFVIGGLTQDSDIVSKSKVPTVGDIPLLGELFHLNNETKAKTELYIVVTPRVIHRGDPNGPPQPG